MEDEVSQSDSKAVRRLCDDMASRREKCHVIIQEHFPGADVTFLANQGNCSYTFFVGPVTERDNDVPPKVIVQFRKNTFALNINTAAEAKSTYDHYAPDTRLLLSLSDSRCGASIAGFRAYQMELIEGVPYKLIVPDHADLSEAEFKKQVELVEGFANFIARGWPSLVVPQNHCDGKVGSIIPKKLKELGQKLPSAQLRAVANGTSKSLDSLDLLPIVLNHGDVLPSNIMVDPVTFTLIGLVDWAEAEHLPFGTCLYGLENLLGYIVDHGSRHRKFVYYNRAPEIRLHFWRRLRSLIPTLQSSDHRDAIILAKKMGTLLWYGFAWDDGSIDRVVNEQDDADELAYLETFLVACSDDLRCMISHRKDSMTSALFSTTAQQVDKPSNWTWRF
jgi:hypothetical protein